MSNSDARSKAIEALGILKDDTGEVLRVWSSWYHLFRHPEADERENRYRLMTSVVYVEPFFAMLQDVLISYAIIGLSRLLDERRDTIGIKTLVSHIELLSDSERTEALALFTQAKQLHRPALMLRHKALVHRNEDFTTRATDQDARSVRINDVEETIYLITRFLDVFDQKLNGATTEWDLLDDDHVLGLCVVLEDAKRFRNLPVELQRKYEQL